MKNTTLAKKFYINALNYIDAINVLKNNIITPYEQSTIYPLLYLERHTVELLLKTLIIITVPQQDVDETMILKWGEYKFNISLTHSLKVLLDKCIEIQNNTRLISIFDEDINEIEKIINSFDELDHSGEYYRYPLNKNGRISKQKMYKIMDMLPEVKSKMDEICILENYDQKTKTIGIIKLLDKKTFFLEQEITDVINYFLNMVVKILK